MKDPGLSVLAQCDRKDPYKKEAGQSKSDEKEMGGWQQRPERRNDTPLLPLKMEKGPPSKECRQPLEAGKTRKRILP